MNVICSSITIHYMMLLNLITNRIINNVSVNIINKNIFLLYRIKIDFFYLILLYLFLIAYFYLDN